ncbi:MAG: cytochrome c biogenesis protein CcsA [Chitinophagaceae bacterium]
MMNFEGEHLLLGQIGHFATLLSFVSAFVACISFFQSERCAAEEHLQWKRMGRISFYINAFCVFAIFLTLSLIIYNHYFEYKYAHQHSKRSLDMQYLFSCFWEGQEGSFMLWNFWVAVIGLVLIRTAKKWEGSVMSIISLSQMFMASFLIGIYFFEVKLGSSPFVLMRNEFPEAPIFKDPQYLFKYLLDGNGLNILLQNYWMVIHPPILFLGFATSIVPFAYAVAGLWKNEHKEWLKPAFPWALFNGAILGLGIMMGAAWAYESLTFGGYWAWDPVENASLVPWMLMVSGIHTMLINKSTGHSFKATYVFIPASFLLVLYSTFLTRTGVLGETSVHAFTGEGNTLYWHLLSMIFTFLFIPVALYFTRRKDIPVEMKEENMNSREFWMFVGSLLLFVSAAYIIILTSLPFINTLLDTHWAIGKDVEYVYNRVMILVAFVIAIMTAITQYFRYKDTTKKQFWSKLLIPTGIAIIVAMLISIFGKIQYEKYGIGFLTAIHLSLWASVFTVIANFSYIISVLKWKMKAAGASITHIGFGLMLIGILISSSKKELISINKTGIAVSGLKDVKGNEENPLENITLVQGIPTTMGNYTVTYEADSAIAKNDRVFFRIHFQKKDQENSEKIIESFNIYPNAFLVKGEQGMNLSSNPGSRHYWYKDIFVYITSWLNPDKLQDTSIFKNTWVKEGDTVYYSTGFILVKEIMTANKHDNADLPVVDSAWLSSLEIHASDGRGYAAQPAFFVKDARPSVKSDTVIAQNLILQINGAQGKRIELGIKESNKLMRYITMKAFEFPMINVLWIGTIIMVLGFLISMYHRSRAK